MHVYVATTNAGKMREFRILLAAHGITAESVAGYVGPPEGETSYETNAALKARGLRAALLAAGRREAVIADDSGLEVEALGGAPGVLTARYGGEGLSWAKRRAVLLAALRDVPSPQRLARFVCVLHWIDPDGAERHARGAVEGMIAAAERGDAGFSFDSVFYYPPAQRTFAQMTDEEKNRVSHRTLALAALLPDRAHA